MSESLLEAAMKLSKAERITLAEQLWDSVAADQDGPPLSQAQREELDRRLERLATTGPRGENWETVKQRLSQRKPS